ncbi:MAG: peptidoglycan-binding protein [Rhizobiaceae bacterium]
MRKHTSYLDSLNEGRQRRSRTSLDDLDRTLRGLEERIGSGRGASMRSAGAAASRDMADRFRNLGSGRRDEARDRHTADHDRVPSSASFKTLAHDIELARVQEKNVTAVETIAAELKSLRNELHNNMATGLQREFDSLRADIAETYRATQSGVAGKELSDDIARLSDNIRALAQRSDDSGINMLRLELEEVKRALGALAREETIQQFNERWDDLDRRWDAMRGGDRHDLAGEPEFQALAARLEDIGDAVNNLPGSLPLGSLDDKLHILAEAVEHLSRNQEPVAPQSLDLIEQRLDEISRAIVASSVSVQAAVPSSEPFERIEARISSLARQIEELTETQASPYLLERIDSLAQRLEHFSDGSGSHPDAVDNLAAQVAALAEKIDSGADGAGSEPLLRELEHRYARLSEMFERQQDATEQQGRALLRDLEDRLDALAGAAGETGVSAGIGQETLIHALDSRFEELARHLDARMSSQGADGTVLRGMEERLAEISARLDGSTSPAAGVDNDLIRSLEGQIAGLTQHLQRPDSVIPDQDDVGPRIREIEQALANNREQIVQAAREAAESAIRALPVDAGSAPSVLALTDDLKALERLTRNSDERNSRTFEAIHDTLLKIVDRLASLEKTASGGLAKTAGESTQLDEYQTPSIEPGEHDHATFDRPIEPADASSRDLAGEIPAGSGRRSMLGGFARALKGRGAADERVEPQAFAAEHPVDDRDEAVAEMVLDDEDANTPLEPGSGAPDLDAIVERVRQDKKGSAVAGADETGKSDFIAAARRAAQAAAAEAETTRSRANNRRSGGHSTAMGVLQRGRKPILIGASVLLIALAGLQLGKAFLGSDGARTVADMPAMEDSTAADDTAAGDMDADGEAIADEDIAEAASASSDVRVVEPNDTAATADSASAMAPGPDMVAEKTDDMAAVKPDLTPAPTATITQVPVEAGPVALREAAETGDAKALYEVASRYAEGRGVQSDLKKAAKWYRAAADLGFAPAQYRIGNFYEKGLGIERDAAKAMTWYQLAAEQGNASAMHNLAVLFAMGAGGQTDNESAARWFGKAAELGVKDSQFNLGILSAKGVGLKQDLEASYKWFALAANTGDKDAAAKRDEIANALRPEQLANARAAVDLWKAKPLVADANTVVVPAEWTEDSSRTAAVDMKQAVKNIQLILNNNGYDAGPADGMMGERTRNAIVAFQKANDMPATGEVDEALVKALLALNE